MKAIVHVSEEACKGCSLCAAACPKKIMELNRETLNSKGYHTARCAGPDACIACGMCAVMCPDSAITVTKEA